MERIHVNYLREIIYRLRQGESERRISQDIGISRPTIHKYRELAENKGYLDVRKAMVEEEELVAALGPAPKPPKIPSSIEPYRKYVTEMVDKGVEMMAIWQRLRDEYGYNGSYSSVRRFVIHLDRQKEPESYVRVHSAPGGRNAGRFWLCWETL